MALRTLSGIIQVSQYQNQSGFYWRLQGLKYYSTVSLLWQHVCDDVGYKLIWSIDCDIFDVPNISERKTVADSSV